MFFSRAGKIFKRGVSNSRSKPPVAGERNEDRAVSQTEHSSTVNI